MMAEEIPGVLVFSVCHHDVQHRRREAATGGRAPGRNWRQRLASMRSYPSGAAIHRFVEETVAPAPEEAADEFRAQDYNVSHSVDEKTPTGVPEHSLLVYIPGERTFLYKVVAVPTAVPTFGARPAPQIEEYFRLEVFTQTGSEGYDLYGVSRDQVIEDVLDRFENHVQFLSYSAEVLTAAFLTPPVVPEPPVDPPPAHPGPAPAQDAHS